MSRKGKPSQDKRPAPPSIPGFRPGKEPAHLRARQARAELGPDAGWAQKAVVDAVANRRPEEIQAQVERWLRILAVVALLLLGGGVALYRVSVIGGMVVHLLAAGVGFLWFRLRAQRNALVTLARQVGRR